MALPRVRDFRGVKGSSFAGAANFAMGLKRAIVFPEINFDQVDEVWGMDIIIPTTAKTDAEAKALLSISTCPSTAEGGIIGHGKEAMVEREKKRQALVDRYAARRAALKKSYANERTTKSRWKSGFKARLKLAKLPRNSLAHSVFTNAASLRGVRTPITASSKVRRIMLRETRLERPDPGMVKFELVRRT